MCPANACVDVFMILFSVGIWHEDAGNLSMTHDKDKDKGHSLLKTTGQLVRSSLSPHSPIWIRGAEYPAQYLVRQTRSMTTRYNSLKDPVKPDSLVLLVSIPRHMITVSSCRQQRWKLPALKFPVEELDFFLPDKDFLRLKLTKLQLNQKQKQEKDRDINKHSLNSTNNAVICTSIQDVCLNSNKMLSSHPSCIEDVLQSPFTFSLFNQKEIPVSFNSCHCTYTCLNEASSSSSTSLTCMGYQCMPFHIQVNNIFHWATNGSQLLMIANKQMYLFECQGQLVTSLTLPDSILKHTKCLQLLQVPAQSSSLAIVGGKECDLWLLSRNSSPFHYSLFKGTTLNHSQVTGLHCMWRSIDCNGVIATSFQIPSPSLWIIFFTINNHQSLNITNRFSLSYQENDENSTVFTSLYFIPQSKYLLSLSNKLLIWDYLSGILVKRVSMQCGPFTRDPLPAVIIHAFMECHENDHIFVVISSKPPTPILINSCCWLITVTMTTYPYMNVPSGHYEMIDNAYVVYAYLLPSNATNQRLSAVCISGSSNRLTAALSNGVIVQWNILQSTPIGYFTLSGSEITIQSCLLVNERLWTYSNSNNLLKQKESHIHIFIY